MSQKSNYLEVPEEPGEGVTSFVGKRDNTLVMEQIRTGFGEFMGVAIIVFVCCMSCIKDQTSALQGGIAGGLSVMTAVDIFGAHANPAVTVSAVIVGKTNLSMACLHVIFQVLGGLAGYATLLLASPRGFIDYGNHCVTLPGENVSGFQAIVVEVIGTFILCMIICVIWDQDKNSGDSSGLRIGLCVTMFGLVAGPYTGGSMNPARSFGPAFWQKNFQQFYVYLIGPLLGGVLSGYCYKYLIKKTNVL